jgi:hypothetical protein
MRGLATEFNAFRWGMQVLLNAAAMRLRSRLTYKTVRV